MDRAPKRWENIKDIVDWLSENVGEYYGTGEDRSIQDLAEDVKEHREGKSVLHIGAGWQLEREWRGDPTGYGYMEVWWRVDITDEAKAMLFALKWIK
jgi:hypothetical protein